MDEKPSLGSPWTAENIPNEHFVSRHFSEKRLKKGLDNRRFPSEADFSLQAGEDGLSVYWQKYIDLKDIYLTIGLTHTYKKNEFKDYKTFKIFKFLVGLLTSIQEKN